ncbi:hypothetical protein [Candidatus Palauibacter sp.]|uniref:hypothetical protein n=1 Tax=Candidatus Palauibacter sp. TaxID=3101350 RepID=UPI003AF28BC0
MSLAIPDGMNLSAQLRNVLKDELLTEVASGTIELLEDQPERDRPMTYTISGLPESATVINMRATQHLKGLADGGDWKRICDYLLVARLDDDERHYAVLLEMKTTIGIARKYREQLRRSMPILDYLRRVCAVEYGQKLSVVRKYVLVGEQFQNRFDKQPTRAGPMRGLVEEYEGIAIRMFAGTGAPFRALVE